MENVKLSSYLQSSIFDDKLKQSMDNAALPSCLLSLPFGAANLNYLIQGICGWNTGQVTNIDGMFENASMLNQDIGLLEHRLSDECGKDAL